MTQMHKVINHMEPRALAAGYKEGLSIDRIDSFGNYCPENCQWLSLADNRGKHRDSIMLSYSGETHPLKTWCDKFGLPTQTVRRFYHNNGKELTEQTLSIAINQGNKKAFGKRRNEASTSDV